MGKKISKNNESANANNGKSTTTNAMRNLLGVCGPIRIEQNPLAKHVFPENSVILLTASETTYSYAYIRGLKDTQDITIMRTLLNAVSAEVQASLEFAKNLTDTDTAIADAKQKDLRPARLLARYLRGNVVYKTDSNGKLSKAIVSDIPLKRTALSRLSSGKAEFYGLTREQKRAAVNGYAVGILGQCKFISAVNKTLAEFIAEAEAVTAKAGKKVAKKTTKSVAMGANLVNAAAAV